jgi:hypothetical protein
VDVSLQTPIEHDINLLAPLPLGDDLGVGLEAHQTTSARQCTQTHLRQLPHLVFGFVKRDALHVVFLLMNPYILIKIS